MKAEIIKATTNKKTGVTNYQLQFEDGHKHSFPEGALRNSYTFIEAPTEEVKTKKPRKPPANVGKELSKGVEAGDTVAVVRERIITSGKIRINLNSPEGKEIRAHIKEGDLSQRWFSYQQDDLAPDEFLAALVSDGLIPAGKYNNPVDFLLDHLKGPYEFKAEPATVEPKGEAQEVAAERSKAIKSIRSAGLGGRVDEANDTLKAHDISIEDADSPTLSDRDAAAIDYAIDLTVSERGLDAHSARIRFVEENRELIKGLSKEEAKVFDDLFDQAAKRIDKATGEDAYLYGSPEDGDIPFDPDGTPRPMVVDELPVIAVRPIADPFASNSPDEVQRRLRLDMDKENFDGRPVSRRDVNDRIAEAAQALGAYAPVSVGRMGQLARHARGFFMVAEEVIRLRTAENYQTLMHEFGHAIEKHIWGRVEGGPFTNANGFNEEHREELMTLGEILYGKKKPRGGYKREGFAEVWRIHLVAPEVLAKDYPSMSSWVKDFLAKNKKAEKAFKKAQDTASTYTKQGAKIRAGQNMVDVRSFRERAKKAKAWLKNTSPTSNWIETGRVLLDVKRAASDVLGRDLELWEDPYFNMEARRKKHPAIARHWVEVFQTDWAGHEVGPGLKDAIDLIMNDEKNTAGHIFRGFLPGKSRVIAKDFSIYLWAMRTIALQQTGRNSGMEINDAIYLRELLEEEHPRFEQAAGMVWTWNDNVLHYAAEASPNFAQLVSRVMENDPGAYVPLKRIFDEYNSQYREIRRDHPSGTGNSMVKRLRGSGRSIKNPFDEMISQAYNTIRAAHEERVIHTLFELAKEDTMGQFLVRVPQAREVKLKVGMDNLFERVLKELHELGVNTSELEESMGDDEWSHLSRNVMTFWGNANRAQAGAEPIVARVNEAGEVEFWQVNNPELFRSLESMETHVYSGEYSWLWNAFVTHASIFRAGTTGYRATFGLVTNPLRDLQTLLVNTQSTASAPEVLWAYFTSMIDAFVYTATGGKIKGKYTDLFIRMGGQMTQPLSQDTSHVKRISTRMFQSKGIKVIDPRNWIDLTRDIIQTPEMAPRIAEMKLLAKKHNIDPDVPTASQALFLIQSAAEVTTDFTAEGYITRTWNRVIPFLNASIQGPRANLRAAKRNVEEMQRILTAAGDKKGLRGIAARGAAAKAMKFFTRGAQMMAMSMLAWWYNKDKDWWKEMGLREKYLYWHIDISDLVGEPMVVRIPRAFEVGLIFGAFPEALLDQWYHDDPEAVKQWFVLAMEYSNPFDLPPSLKEGIQQMLNYDLFFRTPIDSLGDQLNKKKEPRDRVGPYTSGFAIWAGDKLNLSPKRIDHFLRSTIGPVAMDVAHAVTGRGPGFVKTNEPANWPGAGILFTRGGDIGPRPRSVTKLYDLYREYDKHGDDETDEHKAARLLLTDAARLTSTMSKLYTFTEAKDAAGRNDRRAIRVEQIRVAKDAMAAVESGDLWSLLSERKWVKGDLESWEWDYKFREEEVKAKGSLR
jgi:hypothetical protein